MNVSLSSWEGWPAWGVVIWFVLSVTTGLLLHHTVSIVVDWLDDWLSKGSK